MLSRPPASSNGKAEHGIFAGSSSSSSFNSRTGKDNSPPTAGKDKKLSNASKRGRGLFAHPSKESSPVESKTQSRGKNSPPKPGESFVKREMNLDERLAAIKDASPKAFRPQRASSTEIEEPRKASRRKSDAEGEIMRRKFSEGVADASDSDSDGENEQQGGLGVLCQSLAKCTQVDGSKGHRRGSLVATEAEMPETQSNASVMMELFEKAGRTFYVPPGEDFITQGEASDRMYLLIQGTAVMRKKRADGSMQEIEGMHSAGSILGELSFLLGTKPACYVRATPKIYGQTSHERLKLSCIDSKAMRQLLDKQPLLSRRFFFHVAMTLSHRVQQGYADMQSLLRTGGNVAGSSAGLARRPSVVMQKRSAYSIASHFGIGGLFESEYEAERGLLAAAECSLSVETNTADSNGVLSLQVGLGFGFGVNLQLYARVFLFISHLCIEQYVVGVPFKRQAIPLGHIIGVAWTDGVPSAPSSPSASPSNMAIAKPQQQSKDAPLLGDPTERTFEVQIFHNRQGASLGMTMATADATHIAKETEKARLLLNDLTQLEGDGIKAQSFARRKSNLYGDLEAGDRDEALGLLVSNTAATLNQDTGNQEQGNQEKGNQDPVKQDPVKQGMLNHDVLSQATDHLSEMSTAAAGRLLYAEMGSLDEAEWRVLLQDASCSTYRKGDTVVGRGRVLKELYLCVRGVLSVQVKMPGRPHAIVVASLGAGDPFGESSFLLGSGEREVIAESAAAFVVRIPTSAVLDKLDENPVMAGKVFCWLATHLGAKLRQLTFQEHAELTIPEGVDAPRTVQDIAANGAFLHILSRWAAASPDSAMLSPMVELVHEINHLRSQGEETLAYDVIKEIHARHARSGAPHAVTALSEEVREAMTNTAQAILRNERIARLLRDTGRRASLTLKPEDSQSMSQIVRKQQANLKVDGFHDRYDPTELASTTSMTLATLRHVFDFVLEACLGEIDRRCMAQFISSTHFSYVLSLKAKELTAVSAGHFMVKQQVGEGGFGKVLEVVKRDCGKHYAMKVMKKMKIRDAYGEDDWEDLVIVERNLMAGLHHPLLINLAYAFQNVEYLVMVMDYCGAGDLVAFGADGDSKLTASEVKFVGLEVTAIILYLHAQRIMFRDLKPANLLLDDDGHVRLIDFGVAKQGTADEEPTSREECGSGVYVAPEVRHALTTKKFYGTACDCFSLGTLLYELMEQKYPFGDDPEFEDAMAEFVTPALLADDNVTEVPGMYNLLTGLLDWNPRTRLQGRELRAHRYWKSANDDEADWELVEARQLPSPLTHIVKQRMDAQAAQEPFKHGKWRNANSATDTLARKLSIADANQAVLDRLLQEDEDYLERDTSPPPPPSFRQGRRQSTFSKLGNILMPGASKADVDRFLGEEAEGSFNRADESFNGGSSITGGTSKRRRSLVQKLGNFLMPGASQADVAHFPKNGGAEGSIRKPERRKSVVQRIEMENEMRVVDWEYSSPQAIALEYIESNQEQVSAV